MRQEYPFLSTLWEQHRSKTILAIILLLLAVGAYIGQRVIVEPHLQSLSIEQFRLQQNVRQRQVEFANSGVPVSMSARLKKNLQQFNALIPQKIDFSNFLGELFSWAKEAKLEIDQVNYQPEQDKETGYLQYGLSFSVSGSYAQVKNFIHLLENAERLLIIEKISLAESFVSKGQSAVNLNINLTTYFQGGAE